jgi:FkbM family methyltransferase
LCFDVGANYGWKTEVFLRLGARVIAFEPQPECVREIEARLTPQPRLTIEETALGSELGQTTLYIMNHRTNSSLQKDWLGKQVGSIQVPITTLEKMIEKHGVPQFCKIDVEGYELEVLKGLNQKIPIISFEYHIKKQGSSRALACLEYLAQFGQLTINIAPAETPNLTAHQPWPMRDFIDLFNKFIPNMKGYEYGDIFVGVSH